VIDRRTFLIGTGVVLLAAPLAAPAQQAGKVYRIGYVGVAPIPLDDAFRAGLRDLGYLERQNLIIEYRWGREGTGTTYANLVKELLALNVDLIVSVASPPTQAAKEATKVIPIVFVAVGDPVAERVSPLATE
jgi:putative ABC transport system substrate-binding protein